MEGLAQEDSAFDTVEILNGSGHLSLQWDPNDPADVLRAKREVAELKAAGYSFFAVVGVEAGNAIAEGNGRLIVERIEDPTERSPAQTEPQEAKPEVSPPAKAAPPAKRSGHRNVALRPLVGG